MTGSYGDTYFTGVDGKVCRVKEADDDYFLENSVGGIFSIGDGGEMITIKKGGGLRYFKGKYTREDDSPREEP